MNKHLLSIIIPTFNRVGLLKRTIESIINQSYSNWECIIVDDGSTDDTPNYLSTLTILDSRFKFHRNERTKGASGARNTGIVLAKGKYIVLFDSDNLMHTEFMKEMIDFAETNKVDIVTCFANVLYENQTTMDKFNWICNGNIERELFTGESYVDNNNALILTSKLKQIGPTDELCPSFQEWDTHIRLSRKSVYGTIEKVLLDYVRGDVETISSDSARSVEGYFYILEKYFESFVKHKSIVYHGKRILKHIEEVEDNQRKMEFQAKIKKLIPNLKASIRIAKFKHAILKSIAQMTRK